MGNVSKKPPANGFKWVKVLSQFNEDFIKKYQNGDIVHFFEVDIGYPKELFKFHKGFNLKEKRLKKPKNLLVA